MKRILASLALLSALIVAPGCDLDPGALNPFRNDPSLQELERLQAQGLTLEEAIEVIREGNDADSVRLEKVEKKLGEHGLSLEDAVKRIRALEFRTQGIPDKPITVDPADPVNPSSTNRPPTGIRFDLISPDVLAIHRETLRLLGEPDPWAETELEDDQFRVLEEQVPLLLEIIAAHDRGELVQ